MALFIESDASFVEFMNGSVTDLVCHVFARYGAEVNASKSRSEEVSIPRLQLIVHSARSNQAGCRVTGETSTREQEWKQESHPVQEVQRARDRVHVHDRQ